MNELAILDWIQTLHAPDLNQLMIGVSTIGDMGLIWVVIGIVLLFSKKYRPLGIAMIVAVAIAGVVAEFILKPLVVRPRPCDVNTSITLLVNHPSGSSFPSGHTCGAFAAFGAILFSRRPRSPRWFTIVAGILAILIAFSRLYLYVHYPTDVLAGIVIGLVAGWLAVKLVRYIQDKTGRGNPNQQISNHTPRHAKVS